MTISQAFDLALARHRAGRLAEAEGLYRQILAAQPDHADALHLLGVIAHQAGRYDLAAQWIRKAITINPAGLPYYLNLGNALAAQGHLDEAAAAYCRAMEIDPSFADAHNNLGNTLRQQGRLDEAIAAYRHALELNPDYPEACNNLGNALREGGQFDEAITVCLRALRLKPDFPEAHNNLGAALKDRGQIDEAIAPFRRALELRPGYPEAAANLGGVLRERGQLEEAIAACREALGAAPNFPEGHKNLGDALRDRGQLDEAIAAYRRALQLKPDYPEAYNNLGNALRERGRLDEAIAAYRGALRLKRDSPEIHNNLGNALKDRGLTDEAMGSFRHALQLKPDHAEAHNNLGNALTTQGRLSEAIASYRKALQIQPEDARIHSNLIYTLHFLPGHDGKQIAEEQRRWNRQFSEPVKPSILPHANDRDPERRLRIGYLSPDFREHVVGRNLLPLFECHDRRRFEIFCYSEVVQPDRLTGEFRRLGQHWRSTVGAGDEAVAGMIRGDGVDILVDLAQHMAGNRLPVFARKPAPVQVSFAGYPESTGLDAIEYRISDRYLEAGCSGSGGERAGNAVAGLFEAGSVGSADERIERREHVCLIDSFWCYDPCGAGVEINVSPAMETGRVTFGCLNNFSKINERVLSLWARALGKVGDSRLVLLSSAGSHRQRTWEALEKEGIERRRVEFVEFRPRREYLELYHQVDIVLDTFPYNGHTTSLDALWMGVPVVSLAGRTAVSRAGLSQLTNLGLPELAAHSETEYVDIAVGLAPDLPRLAELRSTLRERMEHSVLMDAPRFARQVEQAYREMWERWRAGGG